jgi:hypothetical protein
MDCTLGMLNPTTASEEKCVLCIRVTVP